MAKILEFEFEHLSDHLGYHASAKVEVDGEDVRCIDLIAENWHGGEPSDHMYKVLEQKAEQLAWERENPPRSRRYGCDCLPRVNPLDQAIHDDTCPLRLQGAERQAYLDLVHKEERAAK